MSRWPKLFRACAMMLALAPAARAADAPLVIGKQGYFFVGQSYQQADKQEMVGGQLYVEFQIPQARTHALPIVFVHGGSQSGSNFSGTPDGRDGWAQFFLRKGYATYIVDQVGRGRAAYRPEIYAPARSTPINQALTRFVAPERAGLWPQAHLHHQWPGAGDRADPATSQFLAAQLPSIGDFAQQQKLNRAALVALLDKIGPAIVLTHSQAGAFGWTVTDDRPNLVKALIQIEPSGPPVRDLDFSGPPDWFREIGSVKPWGLGSEKLTYDPAVDDPSALKFEQEAAPEAPGLARCWRQAGTARRLPRLMSTPMLVLTTEASYHAPYDHCTVRYLEQAGVKPDFVRLESAGIKGNGHMLMLERNSDDIAALIADWLDRKRPGGD